MVLLSAITVACLSFVQISHAADVATQLGTAHTTGALGTGTQQNVTVNTDGSIHATLQDGPATTTIDMQLSGTSVILIKRDPWGTSTSVIDLAAGKKFMDANPAVVSMANRGMASLEAIRNARYAPQAKLAPMAAGGPCATQAQNMINAGYAAIMVCSAGPSFGCLSAQNDYDKAVAAYNACMNRMYPPHSAQ